MYNAFLFYKLITKEVANDKIKIYHVGILNKFVIRHSVFKKYVGEDK